MTPRWFARGDIDGFFGLFVDNLVQLLLIDQLCRVVCGMPAELVTGRILPGAAVSIVLGNLFYAWQARQLMRRTGRDDVTALPYGINTPSLFAYILFIMGPVYRQTHDAQLAWQAGLFACFISGVMECAGAFVGDWVRRHTPRAALLSSLAGIAITFIAMGFVFQIFQSPAIALAPMMIVLIAYGSRLRLPLGLPGGLVAVIVGVALGWLFYGLNQAGAGLAWSSWQPFTHEYHLGVHLPAPVPRDVFGLFASATGWKYLAVIFPMGLFNVVGSLQNLESAEAAGDRYETRPSLLANGVGSLAAALFGSAFPTTIYIGHPGWKAMGARAGYSVINAAAVALLVLLGGVTLVQNVVPLEATLGILLWIGVIITAQAFAEVPKRHALAVAVGLVPALGAWAYMIIDLTLLKAGKSMFELADAFGASRADIYLHGVIALNQGFIVSSMVLAAAMACIIDRALLRAAGWMAVAALLSMTGVIHAYALTEQGVENRFAPAVTDHGWTFAAAPAFTVMYALTALMLVALHRVQVKSLLDGSIGPP